MKMRVLRFQAVGALGMMVQMASVIAGREWLGLSVMASTAAAVELAILHNFVWHLRWTWAAQNRGLGGREVLLRLLRFNAAFGAISITSNLYFTSLFMRVFGVNYIVGNLLAIASTGVVNFMAGEFFVFPERNKS
jgi:putative flippase GtrA